MAGGWGCCCQQAASEAVTTVLTVPPSSGATSQLQDEQLAPARHEGGTGAPAPRGREAATEVSDFDVVIDKTETFKLGLDTVARRNPPSLRVKAVNAGVIQAWNSTHPEERLEPECRIIAVNGERSSLEAMYKQLLTNRIVLSVKRPGASH